MVVILSGKVNSAEREIIELLGDTDVVSLKGKANLTVNKGIVIMADMCEDFSGLKLNKALIGICSDTNSTALKIFKKSGLAIITCGMGSKNTVTVSSIGEKSLMLSLQRSIRDLEGKIIEPCEIKVNFSGKDYFPVLAATVAKLICGIYPLKM